MRIRRNASRLLGFASCQPWLSALAPRPVDPSPPPSLLCHLNRSPWDVSPSPSEEPPSPDPPFLKLGEGIMGRNHSLVEAAAAAAAAARGRGDTVVPRVQKSRDKIDGKKQRKHAKAMANELESMVKQCQKRCNKSDGKGWHCKKPAQMPHSLCRYHLAQLRAYNAAYRVPVKGRRRKEGDTGSDFYYYSGFGPWRGKRRCGGDHEDVKKETVHEVEEEEDDSDDDDDDDDDDGVYDDDVGVSSRKRGRKRIKARSLKSLL